MELRNQYIILMSGGPYNHPMHPDNNLARIPLKTHLDLLLNLSTVALGHLEINYERYLVRLFGVHAPCDPGAGWYIHASVDYSGA